MPVWNYKKIIEFWRSKIGGLAHDCFVPIVDCKKLFFYKIHTFVQFVQRKFMILSVLKSTLVEQMGSMDEDILVYCCLKS